METNEEKRRQETEDQEEQHVSNTGGDAEKQEQPGKKGIHNDALYAASMGRPATAQVDPHNNAGLAQTGTNTSYEGPLSAGAGGSAGTGYTSGQPATGAKIATESDYDKARAGKTNDNKKDAAADEAENEMNEQR